MQKPILLALLALLPCLLIAQRQFLNATLTTNNGEKLSGKIVTENWLRTPRSIAFRPTNGPESTYEIKDLSNIAITRKDGFQIFFTRKAVEVEVSPSDLNHLDLNPNLIYEKDTVWLELLYQGSWTLYGLTDKSDKRHYFIAEDQHNPPVELVLKPWMRGTRKMGRIETVDLYKKQLFDLAGDCATSLHFFDKSQLNQKNNLGLRQDFLIKTCKAVDDCKGTAAEYELRREKLLLSAYSLGGMHLSNYRFNPYTTRAIKGLLGWQGGVGLNLYFSKSNENFAFNNEIFFFQDFDKVDTLRNIGLFQYMSIMEYSAQQIGVFNMLSIRIGHLPVTIRGKIGMFHTLKLKNRIRERYTTEDRIDTAQNYDISFYKNFYELGIATGLSASYKRLGLDLKLANANPIGFRVSHKSNSRYIWLNLTYQIFN